MKSSKYSNMINNSLAGYIAVIMILVLSASHRAHAQDGLPVQESIFTAGVTHETNGQAWAYILWQSNAPEMLDTRTFSVWQKAGTPSSPGKLHAARGSGVADRSERCICVD